MRRICFLITSIVFIALIIILAGMFIIEWITGLFFYWVFPLTTWILLFVIMTLVVLVIVALFNINAAAKAQLLIIVLILFGAGGSLYVIFGLFLMPSQKYVQCNEYLLLEQTPFLRDSQIIEVYTHDWGIFYIKDGLEKPLQTSGKGFCIGMDMLDD